MKSIVGVLIVLFLALNTGKEFLHNHGSDNLCHDNCPVLVINSILSSAVVVVADIPEIQTVEIVTPHLPLTVCLNAQKTTVQLRAPPFI